MRIRLFVLALKRRENITRDPKQGYQWSPKRTCQCVLENIKGKKTMLRFYYVEIIYLVKYRVWLTQDTDELWGIGEALLTGHSIL